MTASPAREALGGRTRQAVFARNPAVAYVAGHRLAQFGFRRGGHRGTDDAYAGVLHAAAQRWIGVRAVGRSVADLWNALRSPRRISAREWNALGADADIVVARLVLDGVLTIASGVESLSGAAAVTALMGPATLRALTKSANTGAAMLTDRAIAYGASLGGTDAEMLAARLYFFHRLPLTQASIDGAAQALAGRHHAEMEAELRTGWRAARDAAPDAFWAQWWPRARRSVRGHRWKLFLSPTPPDTGRALELLVRTLARIGPAPLKYPRDPAGLLRPDKIVCYFPNRRQLIRSAAALCIQARSINVHGVPFAAPVDGRGLISWGVDPDDDAPIAWRARDSWRLAIANLIARALVTWQHTSDSTSLGLLAFCRLRVRLERLAADPWGTPLVRSTRSGDLT